MKRFLIGTLGFFVFLTAGSIVVGLPLVILETSLDSRALRNIQSSLLFNGVLSGLALATLGFAIYGVRVSIDLVENRSDDASSKLSTKIRSVNRDLGFPSRLAIGIFAVWNPFLFLYIYVQDLSITGRWIDINAFELIFLMAFPSLMSFTALKIWDWIANSKK